MSETVAAPSRTSQRPRDPLLELAEVSKTYGRAQAVRGLDLSVPEGEFVTLLGPSGCGKSTTLRLIRGLERIDTGQVVYAGQVMDSRRPRTFVPAHRRDIGMVFQSYAVWPHMSVFENVAYPLRLRRVRDPRPKVEEMLDLVGLAGIAGRSAAHLSGGQQQRVALARALVFRPALLLLDEPFSNLDARLRDQVRMEVKTIQRRVGATVLLVTHDQVEALSLSDRVLVMREGTVLQSDTPRDLYDRPVSAFVRDFLGSTVLLPGVVSGDERPQGLAVSLEGADVLAHAGDHPANGVGPGVRCEIAVRPEHVELRDAAPPNGGTNAVPARVLELFFVGDRFQARLRTVAGQEVAIEVPRHQRVSEDQDVFLCFPVAETRAWPAGDG